MKRRDPTNRRFLLIAACTLVLAAIMLAAGCTTATTGNNTTTPAMPGDAPGTLPGTAIALPDDTHVTLPVPTIAGSGSTSETCQFTSCHGLSPACGMSELRMCTMEYQLGDKCRQYAQCTSGGDGTCSLVKSPAFDTCVSCARKCSQEAGSDPVAAFDCEATC